MSRVVIVTGASGTLGRAVVARLKADGIVVPHVESAEEAASIVELVRYACGPTAADKLVVVQIETQAAVTAASWLS